MSRRVSAVGAISALFCATAAAANPFTNGRPGDAGATAERFMTMPYAAEIMNWQRQIHDALTSQIEALQAGTSLAPLWGLLLVSFAYGVFHVLAPGHGKVIVSSYFLGHHARWKDGIVAGLIMAVGHTVTAVGLALGLHWILRLSQLAVLEQARYVELVGYGLIAAIGVWLLVRAVKPGTSCGCGHAHPHDHASHQSARLHHVPIHRSKHALSLFAVTSLVPCTGSMIILLFTLANGVLWAGMLGVACIALGMWATVSAIGIVTIITRYAVLERGAAPEGWRRGVMRGVGVLAALVVTLTGGILCWGVWQSLSG